MRLLALILARGGSKRVPGKNIRWLGSRPLIDWSIESARGLEAIVDTLVSTDDEAIAEQARRAGALVPWLRPAELASDTSPSIDACLHALDWYERERGTIEGVLLLQPTSPFRTRASLLRGIELFETQGARPVIGVSPAHPHPLWCFRIEEGRLLPFVDGRALRTRSQDLPPAYAVNGAFYLASPRTLRKERSFYADDMVALPMLAAQEALDIDTEWDWKIAQCVAAEGLHEL